MRHSKQCRSFAQEYTVVEVDVVVLESVSVVAVVVVAVVVVAVVVVVVVAVVVWAHCPCASTWFGWHRAQICRAGLLTPCSRAQAAQVGSRAQSYASVDVDVDVDVDADVVVDGSTHCSGLDEAPRWFSREMHRYSGQNS